LDSGGGVFIFTVRLEGLKGFEVELAGAFKLRYR
jgi:hypothetical protein